MCRWVGAITTLVSIPVWDECAWSVSVDWRSLPIGAPATPTARMPVTDMDGATPGGRCPYPHPPRWDEGTREQTERIAREAAGASGLCPERAAGMAVRAAESRADAKRLEAITELFVRTLGKKLGHGHPLSDRTGMAEFTWTVQAEARLADV